MVVLFAVYNVDVIPVAVNMVLVYDVIDFCCAIFEMDEFGALNL